MLLVIMYIERGKMNLINKKDSNSINENANID